MPEMTILVKLSVPECEFSLDGGFNWSAWSWAIELNKPYTLESFDKLQASIRLLEKGETLTTSHGETQTQMIRKVEDAEGSG